MSIVWFITCLFKPIEHSIFRIQFSVHENKYKKLNISKEKERGPKTPNFVIELSINRLQEQKVQQELTQQQQGREGSCEHYARA